MYKIESICFNCNNHYAVVTEGEEDILYCPFCGAVVDDNEDDDEEVE